MTAVGIDLGSTHCAVAVLDRDARPRILTTAHGATTMPSMVGLVAAGGRVRAVVGEAARALQRAEPDAVVFGIKRLLGRRADDADVRRWSAGLPFEVVAAGNGDAWVRVRGVELSPAVLAALLLAELRACAERFLGEVVDEAVIAVPARFDAAQRQAVKDAAALAGMTVRRLISEPTAAALGHGAHDRVARRYAVCDLGGGTFDVAVCDVGGGLLEVLAAAGDPLLGGDDVDDVVAEQLAAAARARHGDDVRRRPAAWAQVIAEARRVKHALSDAATVEAALPDAATGAAGGWRTVRRDELALWAAPVLRRLEAPCHQALARAALAADAIDEVLAVGGMTRMPAVRRKLGQILGREPVVVDNPDEVVAIGAAIEVARLDGRVGGVLLVDVTARGLALGVEGGRCDVIIPAGCVVPTREHRLLATTTDDQATLAFTLYHGDSDEPARNQPLATYEVSALPAAPAGDALVLVEVTVDVDGTTRVSASELVSGERPPLHVVGQCGLAPAALAELARTVAEWRAT